MTVRKTKKRLTPRKQFVLTPELDQILRDRYGKGERYRYSLLTQNAVAAARKHLAYGGTIPSIEKEDSIKFTISKNATWENPAFDNFDWIQEKFSHVFGRYIIYYILLWYLDIKEEGEGQ